MAKTKFNSEDHLYMQVSDGIEKMIAEEVLRIGDKLPSVRVLSEEYGISMGTAFQAYYHLEGRGLIEARPKSGYYVRFSHRRFPKLPQPVQPDSLSHEVSVTEMIASIYKDIAASGEMNFALAECYLETGNYSDANNIFLNISNGQTAYAEQAKWYLALSALKQKDYTQCRNYLLNIPPSSPYFSKAKQLLQKLPG